MAGAKTKKTSMPAKKEKTVEEIYQKKTPLEHILLRPDTYIGSVERETQEMYIYHKDAKKIRKRTISYVPGLYKIFDEILVNAADNKIRDPAMDCVSVTIEKNEMLITIENNGKGIPIEIHKEEKVYVPELIFGSLLTSSNYDDTEKKVTGGRNGYGAKLCNIFSTLFVVETENSTSGLRYRQEFRNNMTEHDEPEITSVAEGATDRTRITFRPDLKRFGMKVLDDDIIALMERRVYDIAGILPSVRVVLNGSEIALKGFKDYVGLYFDRETPVVYERINRYWEVAVSPSNDHFHQVSFVNAISTSKGGTHVTHVLDQLVPFVTEEIRKKEKHAVVKPFQIKNAFFIFVNALVENPSFDSQTKETLTLRSAKFGTKCTLSAKYMAAACQTGILENILEFAKIKMNAQFKKTDGHKTTRLSGIPKLDDANLAGTKRGHECTLILTEGDSAKALAVSGLSIVGRDLYGVFPLRGKLLNVREATPKQIMENAEIVNIKKIIGLQHQREYATTDNLRYGHVMIMTDQDHDGSHIKGLIINFFDYFFPSLLRIKGFLKEFITPIVRAKKGKDVLDFFTIPEYETWKEATREETGWHVKYYKGLGTSTAADAKLYFSDLAKHVKDFTQVTESDREMIELAFSKKKIMWRKEWLNQFVQGTYLDNGAAEIAVSDFVNKELILFSMADNIRSIPSVVDGLKPGQRKVIFCCFKRKLSSEIKVAQLVGYISEHSAYHHGEASLSLTIVNLAQDFVGSNNIPLLQPIGQFGTRIQGGKDAASTRYIFTALSPLARKIFNSNDDSLVVYNFEDNQKIEPVWYVPIIPFVLVNGSEGIGTGWSTNIPCYNPIEICRNIINMLQGIPVEKMHPFYYGYTGSIEEIGEGKYRITGKWTVVRNVLEITELPVGTWTQNYKEMLETMIQDGDIKDFKEYHTEKNVHFSIRLTERTDQIEKKFRLSTTISTTNMVCFSSSGTVRKYASPEEILHEFYAIRYAFYEKRKEHMLAELKHNLEKIENQVKFILEIISGSLEIRNVPKNTVVEVLRSKQYTSLDGYDYLLSMKMWSLTKEKADELQAECRAFSAEYAVLAAKTPSDMWLADLEEFLKAYEAEYPKMQHSVQRKKKHPKK